MNKQDTGGEIKKALENLSEKMAFLEERCEILRSCYRLHAWRSDGLPHARSTNHHRLEAGVIEVIKCERALARCRDEINLYIDVLLEHVDEISKAAEMAELLRQRYLQHREWECIMNDVYRDDPDLAIRKNAVRRRMFRLVNKAYLQIWLYWTK